MTVHLSGTVRFSVESLLYYAPKITGTGETLASAVNRVQRELLDLGDFFGSSWPDEPFRNSYPRCQYAMLIIARLVADEIRGLGGGIEQMARTYGITESQNVADIQRIQAGQGQTAARISHTGGLPAPPVVPAGMTTPAQSANPFAPHPDPMAPSHRTAAGNGQTCQGRAEMTLRAAETVAVLISVGVMGPPESAPL